MRLDAVIAHCLAKPHVTEETPFGPEVLVFKVAGKLFALTSPDEFPATVNLKCDPGRALDLRDQYPAIQPGYHMNKKMWNTIYVDGSVSDDLLCEWIDHSYNEVVKKMNRKQQQELDMI